MIDWLKGLLADSTGTPDDARVAGLIMVLTFCGTEIYNVVGAGRPFDMWQFGTGGAAMATSLGLWLRGRGDK
ncbi:MAG: hypothetical protein ACYC0M_15360 [Burkholderiales bacterium]